MNLFELINKNNLNIYTYTKNYKAGDIIFNAGDICDKIGYIVSGEASIITITHTEKEETISYLNAESIFGDLLIFASDNLYLGHCICKKDTTIRFISKSSLLELFKNYLDYSNKWVEEKTDGMIKNILDEIPTDAVMYLINALAFEAEWENKYDSTQIWKDATFTTSTGEEQKVDMMRSEEWLYLSDEEATGFIKRYKGGNYAFVALL